MKSYLHFLFYFIRLPWFFLRLNKISLTARISTNCFFRNVRIGAYTYISRGVIINDTILGNYCSIAPGCQIGAMNHDFGKISTSARLISQSEIDEVVNTLVGHNVWIGANSIILSGVKIGNGAIIGANSFVKIDVPAYSIVFGTPAKIYKYRYSDSEISKIEKSQFWKFKHTKAKEVLSKLI